MCLKKAPQTGTQHILGLSKGNSAGEKEEG